MARLPLPIREQINVREGPFHRASAPPPAGPVLHFAEEREAFPSQPAPLGFGAAQPAKNFVLRPLRIAFARNPASPTAGMQVRFPNSRRPA
jgi:hypothetical protein